MADLVGGDRGKVVRAAVPESLPGVEKDVAGGRVVVHRGRHAGRGQPGGVHVVSADADVAHAGISLLVVARALWAAIVRDHGEIGVGLLGPELGGLEDEVFPGRGGPKCAVELRHQVAGVTVDAGSVRHEADGDQLRGGPHIARRRVKDDARFQVLQTGTCAACVQPASTLVLDLLPEGREPCHGS